MDTGQVASFPKVPGLRKGNMMTRKRRIAESAVFTTLYTLLLWVNTFDRRILFLTVAVSLFFIPLVIALVLGWEPEKVEGE